MRVVLRKFSTDQQWNICGVFATEEFADAEVVIQVKTGREAKHFDASHVWIDENGNHTFSV